MSTKYRLNGRRIKISFRTALGRGAPGRLPLWDGEVHN